jgi:hypothetical protein
LKEGIKMPKKIEQLENELMGWVRLLPRIQGEQGRFILFRNTKPQGGWSNFIETQELELGGDGHKNSRTRA